MSLDDVRSAAAAVAAAEQQLRATVAAALADGAEVAETARAAGVSRPTIYRWQDGQRVRDIDAVLREAAELLAGVVMTPGNLTRAHATERRPLARRVAFAMKTLVPDAREQLGEGDWRRVTEAVMLANQIDLDWHLWEHATLWAVGTPHPHKATSSDPARSVQEGARDLAHENVEHDR